MADMMDYFTRGWVKIMRVIVNSRSYDNPNATAAYTHCLMRANIKSGIVKGVFLQRGQFLTSVEQFADECGMSEKQMRTALDLLEADRLIKKELAPSMANKRANIRANNSKKRGTIITVVDYGFEDNHPDVQDEKLGEKLGEETGDKPGEKLGEDVGNSIININNNETDYYVDNMEDMDCPELEGNTRGVPPTSSGPASVHMPPESENFVTNPEAIRLSAMFRERGFVYDGHGRGGLEGYIANQLSSGVLEQYLVEALDEYEIQVKGGNKIRNHMAYYNSVLCERIESHNQGLI